MNALKRWLIRREAEKFIDNAIKGSDMSQQMKAWLIGAVNALGSGLAAGLGGSAIGVDLKHSLGI